MKRLQQMFTVAISATVLFTACKAKDADIKTAVDQKIAATPALSGAMSAVKDGTATISGELNDPAGKGMVKAEISTVKDVKSVIDNTTVAPPPPPPVETPASATTTLDAATQQKVKDGLKDIPGVTVAFTNDRAKLTGEVTKANRMKIMQMLGAAGVKLDATSQLTDKK